MFTHCSFMNILLLLNSLLTLPTFFISLSFTIKAARFYFLTSVSFLIMEINIPASTVADAHPDLPQTPDGKVHLNRRVSSTPSARSGWHATGKDADALIEFRKMLIEKGYEKVETGELIEGVRTTDSTLLRFLIARKYVLKDAVDMFEYAIKYRRDHNFVDICAKYSAFLAGGMQEDRTFAYANKFFYGGLWGESLTGGPVGVERIGIFDVSGFVRRGGDLLDSIVTRAYTLYIHTLFDRVCSLDRRPQGDGDAVLIVDGRGIGMAHMRHHKAIIKLAKIIQETFPEFVRKVFAVNMPKLARGIWKLSNTFCPQKRSEKCIFWDPTTKNRFVNV